MLQCPRISLFIWFPHSQCWSTRCLMLLVSAECTALFSLILGKCLLWPLYIWEAWRMHWWCPGQEAVCCVSSCVVILQPSRTSSLQCPCLSSQSEQSMGQADQWQPLLSSLLLISLPPPCSQCRVLTRVRRDAGALMMWGLSREDVTQLWHGNTVMLVTSCQGWGHRGRVPSNEHSV